MTPEIKAAAERLQKLFAGQSYRETYGCDQTLGGHQQRDERKIIDAYLAEHFEADGTLREVCKPTTKGK